MRKPISAVAFAIALAVCFATVGLASSQAAIHRAQAPSTSVGLPITVPASLTALPAGFSTDAGQATKSAERNRTMLALHAREHPLSVQVSVWEGRSWFVDFAYHGKRVAEVVEDRSARVTAVWTGPLALATYARGDFAPLFGDWWVLVPFSLLFLVPFLDFRRPWRMLHLDALVLESFLVSYLLFDHAQLEPAVWLAYPPMLYLLARMLWIGWRPDGGMRDASRRAMAALSPALSVRVLGAGLIALLAARVGLSLVEHDVVDVGYASVVGAHRIAGGQSLYYANSLHADTYGPITYLAYVPFELLFPWRGTWDYLAAAHAASIFFDLVTVLGLVLLGRRLRGGPEGLRLGLALGWAWAACPFTLLPMMLHTNDGLVAMLSVLSLLAFASPAARGALLGLAAAAKFGPAALLGLFAAGPERKVKGMLVCLGSFALVIVTAIGLYLPSGGLTEFYRHTLGFQLSRSDVFSPWALHGSLDPLKTAVEAGALALCAIVTFIPRRRSLAQVSALAAAVTIAVELPAQHWFYYFVVWFMPFVFVALLASGGDDESVIEPSGAAVAAPPTSSLQRVHRVHAGV